MKKSDLAERLRRKHYDLVRSPKVLADVLDDDKIIECHTTCSFCGEKMVSDQGLARLIAAVEDEHEFIGILGRDPKTLVALVERWAKENYPTFAYGYEDTQELINKCHDALGKLGDCERLYVYAPGPVNPIFEVGPEAEQVSSALEVLPSVSYQGGMIFVGDFEDGVDFRPVVACMSAIDDE